MVSHGGPGRPSGNAYFQTPPACWVTWAIAETFNTSIDYLVTPDAPRRPLHALGNALDARLADLSQLTDDG
jgi:hypothetical protein